jgi:hypothetical protein
MERAHVARCDRRLNRGVKCIFKRSAAEHYAPMHILRQSCASIDTKFCMVWEFWLVFLDRRPSGPYLGIKRRKMTMDKLSSIGFVNPQASAYAENGISHKKTIVERRLTEIIGISVRRSIHCENVQICSRGC